MKSSIAIVAASALLASAAGPIQKRAMLTEWVTDIVTVTVTEGDHQPTAAAVFIEKPAVTTAAPPPPPPSPTPAKKPETTKPVVQAPPPPPPKPSTTSVIQAPPPVVNKPAPVPEVTKQAPAPVQSSAPAPAPAPVDGGYKGTVLHQHNVHRFNHTAPSLQWDDQLAEYAALIAASCQFHHDMGRGGGHYGQNIAAVGFFGTEMDATKAAANAVTNEWYSEASKYDSYGDSNPTEPNGQIGHFTQLVWKDSTKTGCATQRCPAGSIFGMESYFTVCNYSPQGNFGGDYADNVLRPIGQAAVSV